MFSYWVVLAVVYSCAIKCVARDVDRSILSVLDRQWPSVRAAIGQINRKAPFDVDESIGRTVLDVQLTDGRIEALMYSMRLKKEDFADMTEKQSVEFIESCVGFERPPPSPELIESNARQFFRGMQRERGKNAGFMLFLTVSKTKERSSCFVPSFKIENKELCKLDDVVRWHRTFSGETEENGGGDEQVPGNGPCITPESIKQSKTPLLGLQSFFENTTNSTMVGLKYEVLLHDVESGVSKTHIEITKNKHGRLNAPELPNTPAYTPFPPVSPPNPSTQDGFFSFAEGTSFWTNYWQKQCKHFVGAMPILQWAKLSEQLVETLGDQNAFSHTHLFWDSKEIYNHKIASVANFYDELGRTHGIRIPRAERFSGALSMYVRELSSALGFDASVNAYFGGANSSMLKLHTDTTPTFVVQARGRKKWEICAHAKEKNTAQEGWTAASFAQLLETYRARRNGCNVFTHEEYMSMTCKTIILHPGDVLYVPRGTVHKCSALAGDMSIHYTFAVRDRDYTWEKVLEHSLRTSPQSHPQSQTFLIPSKSVEAAIGRESSRSLTYLAEVVASESGYYFLRPFPMWLASSLQENSMHENDGKHLQEYLEFLLQILNRHILKSAGVRRLDLFRSLTSTWTARGIVLDYLKIMRGVSLESNRKNRR